MHKTETPFLTSRLSRLNQKSMKRFGFLLSVLAVLILVGIQLSPAWTPFFEKDGQKIEICTLQGIKTIVFNANGQPVEQEDQHKPVNHCPLCMLRTASLLAPQSPAVPLPTIFVKRQGLFTENIENRAQPRYHLYHPRDPPLFSA